MAKSLKYIFDWVKNAGNLEAENFDEVGLKDFGGVESKNQLLSRS